MKTKTRICPHCKKPQKVEPHGGFKSHSQPGFRRRCYGSFQLTHFPSQTLPGNMKILLLLVLAIVLSSCAARYPRLDPYYGADEYRPRACEGRYRPVQFESAVRVPVSLR